MSEQEEKQTDKKKTGIIKQILKWLGLGFLTLLLIALIILQASWKIITVPVIILLACITLPKPCRKYFWLSVGVVVVALIIWVFLPAETEGWRPYTFDEELAELQAKYSIPDEENAATIYNQLLEEYDEYLFRRIIVKPAQRDYIKKQPWTDEEYPEIARWLGQQEGTISQIFKACEIKNCYFPMDAGIEHVDNTMHRLKPMQQWALLLTWSANNDIAEGRTEEGLQKYFSVIQMGKHLEQQPSMRDFLVGSGIQRNSTRQLKNLVATGNFTEEYLNIIEQTLAENEHNWNYDFPKLLDYEKLLAKNFIGSFYEVNTQGKIRFSRNPFSAFAEQMKGEFGADVILEPLIYPTYCKKKLIKAATIWSWFYMPSTPQKAGALVDAGYAKFYAMAESDYNWEKVPVRALPRTRLNFRFIVDLTAVLLEETYHGVHDTHLRTIAQQRGSRIIIALRRYKNENGSWPTNLSEVKSSAAEEIFTDTTNGSDFVYKSTGEAFILYSKGKNGIDNDCRYSSDDWLIWSSEEHNIEKGESIK